MLLKKFLENVHEYDFQRFSLDTSQAFYAADPFQAGATRCLVEEAGSIALRTSHEGTSRQPGLARLRHGRHTFKWLALVRSQFPRSKSPCC